MGIITIAECKPGANASVIQSCASANAVCLVWILMAVKHWTRTVDQGRRTRVLSASGSYQPEFHGGPDEWFGGVSE